MNPSKLFLKVLLPLAAIGLMIYLISPRAVRIYKGIQIIEAAGERAEDRARAKLPPCDDTEETETANAFCRQMGDSESVCQRYRHGEIKANHVLNCVVNEREPLMMGEYDSPPSYCFSDVDNDRLENLDIETRLDREFPVDWKDGQREAHHAQLMKMWARQLDSTDCERGTRELTSVRCVLHAAAMAEFN